LSEESNQQLQRLNNERKIKLTVRDHIKQWKHYLCILDDQNEYKQSSEEQRLQAQELCVHGYLKILLMKD